MGLRRTYCEKVYDMGYWAKNITTPMKDKYLDGWGSYRGRTHGREKGVCEGR